MSHFGELVKKLRQDNRLTLEAVAKEVGTFKGYVCGIENDKVNPPSVKMIRKFAKLFGLEVRPLVRLAWVDKAPAILREEAEEFLKSVLRKSRASEVSAAVPLQMAGVPSARDSESGE
jgi:transcriptional regulator with XRE-family HTH domain